MQCGHLSLSLVRRVGAGRVSRRVGGDGEELSTVVYKYDLEHVDVLEFKEFGLKMNIYKHNCSNAKTYVCRDHV
jgi:hypothetical protein